MAPPRPRCCLNVGVTGHRLNRASQEALDRASPVIERLLVGLRRATVALAGRDPACFAETPPEFRLLSGLAEGSDRHVAALAQAQGYALHAVLPFPRDVYADDFPAAESRARYVAFLDRAERIFELPGERAQPERGYEMVGRALVAHSDILIALWDGAEGQGPGGTAAVVALALERSVPVLHVRPGADIPPRVIWTGLARQRMEHHAIGDHPSVECNDAAVERVLGELLLPAGDRIERDCIAQYFGETERRRRLRIEYPLLLALTGVRRLGASTFVARPYAEATAQDWAPFRAALAGMGGGDTAATGELQAACAWSDNLANHFAQVFRSGHVLNFALAAVAVLLALAGLIWPAAKLWFIVAELAVIGALVLNTRVGRAQQWHRRWLDYRYLAECLRPMRSLKLFGIARAAERHKGMPTQTPRWPDWYAESLWRQMGCPSGRVDASYARRLGALVVAQELRPQIDYHGVTAHRMHTLEHRLHRVGNALFGATIAACVVFLAGYFVAHDRAVALAPIVTAITAALPALGGAIYGIRVHGDFGGAASRSLKAAAELQLLSEALDADPPPGFAHAAVLAESAARLMLSDLAEWQLTYRQRGLDIPG